jgi:hypothetical protein
MRNQSELPSLAAVKTPISQEALDQLLAKRGPTPPGFLNPAKNRMLYFEANLANEERSFAGTMRFDPAGSKITALVLDSDVEDWVVRSDSRGFGVGGSSSKCAFASIVW